MFSLFALFAFEMMFAFGAGMSGYLFSEVCGLCQEEESFFENFFGHSIEWFVILFNDLVKRYRKRSYQNLVLFSFIYSNILLAKYFIGPLKFKLTLSRVLSRVQGHQFG